MSGAEASFVLGLVSSLITIIETTKKVYDAAKDAKGQPEAFRQVAARLPLILNILENTRKRVPTLDEDAQDALESTLESCKSKAEELKKIFEKVVRKNDDKWIDRYKRAVKATLGKQARVEGLMEGILKDIQVLACEKLTGTASPAEIEEIKEAMKEMEDMPSSLPEDTAAGLHQHNEKGDNFGVTGGSTLNVHTGKGDQHNNKIAGDAHFNINSSDLNKCIKDLGITNPHLDRSRIEQTKGGLLKDAYRWILDNPAFQGWREGSQNQLLWIKGDPGKGKTMLLCGIINELQGKMPQNGLLAYFFCEATDSRINSATAVLRGLLYLLINQQPSLARYVRKEYDHTGKTMFEDVNAWFALTEIFKKMLWDLRLTTTYLLVDALDECVTGLSDLLKFITEQSSTSSNIKWIVSSRNWPQIEKPIEKTKLKVRLSLELNAASVSEAVETFIKHRVNRLAQENDYDEQTERKIQDHLLSKADNTFLWVALACQQLQETEQRHVDEQLKSIPDGLYALYEHMMQRISTTRDAKLCKQVLAVVALVYRPVTLKELATLVKPLGSTCKDAEQLQVIRNCGSFLTVRDQTVYFVHQSAKEFLLDNAAQELFLAGREAIHHTIFARSLQIMSSILQRDMYSLKALGTSIEDVSTPDPDPLATLRYSCVYWVNHLCDIKPTNSVTYLECLQDGGVVDRFLRGKYLYWLESISLLKSMSEGIVSMRKLEMLVQEQGKTPFTQLVHDAYRFIMYHQQLIENNPLQAYASALLFSPNQSLVRRLFQHEEPKGITIMPVMSDRWSACLQTLENHSFGVTSVTFSHDWARLASASKNGTVKVWDTNGACLQKLEGHKSAVNAVAFSHDSTRLASASKDGIIKIWDNNGAHLKTLEGHTSAVKAVAFSHDSTRLVSASRDRTIKVWDTDGICLQTLKEDNSCVNSVSFSHDSKLLVSASNDMKIRIWDATNLVCRQTLKGHRDWVNAVVFSHDSTQFASAYKDGTIEIWDANTLECRQTLKGHSDSVNSVVFSHDSTRVASASDDNTIKIWDASSSRCLQTLLGHSNCVNSVVFSHDSMQLVSASNDGTIKTWDTRSSDAGLHTLHGHSRKLNILAFSPNSLRLASTSGDTTIKIWDTSNSGACLHTLMGHSDRIDLAVFSPDSSRLASASYEGILKIWDINTSGTCLQTLSTSIYSPKQIGFSPDSKWLALMDGYWIKIWDMSSGGKCLKRIWHGVGLDVHFFIFSHDSTRLASVAGDNSIRIWDMSSSQRYLRMSGSKSMSGIYFLVFSHDLTSLAAISEDKTIRIWNTSNGECLQTMTSDRPLVRSRFDDKKSISSIQIDFINVRATMGSDIDDFAMPPYPEVDLGPHVFSSDGDWILFKDKKMVWLPSDFRPLRWNICQNVVGIATGSGRVWSYRVDIEKASQLDL